MAEDSYQDRTEQPTPKRRQEARRRGHIARSRDLSTALVLFTGLGLLVVWGPWAAARQKVWLSTWLATLQPGWGQPGEVWRLFQGLSLALAGLLAPVLLGLMVASLAAAALQGGFLFAPQRLAPDLSRLLLLPGLKRLFSGQSFLELAKALLKVALIGVIAYLTVAPLFPRVPELLFSDPARLPEFLASAGFKVGWRILLGLLVLGILDYLLQRYRFEKNLRMTKQEVKEEMRQTEGDPRIKARMRSLMRQMATRRMMAEVPRADVVITNPTHVAVALKYDGATMIAPQVVAKGQGFVALKIMALAQEAGVPLVENVALARTLYKSVELGAFIPTSLYRAVAEVLAYVYSLRGRRPHQGGAR
ncbi:MAG: flagellar biosynthesis protein FlhB [Desulfobaccales bacterium]